MHLEYSTSVPSLDEFGQSVLKLFMICTLDEDPRLRKTSWQEVPMRSFMVLSCQSLLVVLSTHLTHRNRFALCGEQI